MVRTKLIKFEKRTAIVSLNVTEDPDWSLKVYVKVLIHAFFY